MANIPKMFSKGIYFEVVRGPKRSDMLAAGGRYCNSNRCQSDTLTVIARYDPIFEEIPLPPAQTLPSVRAVGVQIAVDKIITALVAHQRASVKDLVKERKSFGFWSPRRCDVYVVSHQKGQFTERLETVAMLWQHAISADLMYEAAFEQVDENPVVAAAREGILYVGQPRIFNVLTKA